LLTEKTVNIFKMIIYMKKATETEKKLHMNA